MLRVRRDDGRFLVECLRGHEHIPVEGGGRGGDDPGVARRSPERGCIPPMGRRNRNVDQFADELIETSEASRRAKAK